MKCQVLLVNRNRAKLYKRASYQASAGIIKRGLLKGDFTFYIPDTAQTFDLEGSLGRATPLWIVNELTACVLSVNWVADPFPLLKKEEPKRNRRKQPETEEEPEVLIPPVVATGGLREVPYQRKKEYGGALIICERSDPETKLKLNVLAKEAFWSMLAKQLKLGLLKTIVYLSAGGGIFLTVWFVIKVIFLKEATF